MTTKICPYCSTELNFARADAQTVHECGACRGKLGPYRAPARDESRYPARAGGLTREPLSPGQALAAGLVATFALGWLAEVLSRNDGPWRQPPVARRHRPADTPGAGTAVDRGAADGPGPDAGGSGPGGGYEW